MNRIAFFAVCLTLAACLGSADASVCRQRVVVPVVQAAIAVVPAYGAGYAGDDYGDTKAINDRLDRLEKLLQQLLDSKQPVPVQVDPAAKGKPAAKLSARDEAAIGYATFLKANNCLQCHGQIGAKGGLVLARDGKIAKLTAEQREAVIMATYFSTMPPKKFLDDNKLKPVDDQGYAAVMAAVKEGILR